MPVNVVTLSPTISVREQDEQYGKDLFARDPDLCCKLRKVQPLTEGLASYDAWATGLRREETHNRVIAPVVGWDEGKQKVKVSPLARWTRADVDRYIAEHDVLGQPLAVRRLPLHRMLAMHASRGSGRRCPQRTLGGDRQDRMRYPLMSAPALIALAHGSRDPRSARTVREIVAATKALRPDLKIEPAFLDHSRPDLDSVVDRLVARGHTEIVVVPLLLTEAYHARVDVPEVVTAAAARHEGLGIRVAEVVGTDAALLSVLDVRLREALRRVPRA